MEELALHILDLVENSIRAEATRISVEVEEQRTFDRLVIEISDNGKGMDQELVRRATSPFFSTKEGHLTGLGLALFAQAAAETGGEMSVTSRPGAGTKVRAWFVRSHIDCKPLGDIAGTLELMRLTHPEIEFRYKGPGGQV